MKLTKIHQTLSFKQLPILAEYIQLNTKKRAEPKNDFEKDLFKLFNNAIFVKTCENVEKRIDVKLLNSADKLVKQESRPYFRDSASSPTPSLRVKCARRRSSITVP